MAVVQEDRNDASLVRAAQAGDRDAFGELYRRHHADVRRVCARRLGDLAEADEVAQAAFVRAYERIDRCRGDRRFGGWVQVIALRMCADTWRSRTRVTPVAEAAVWDRAGADDCEEAVLRRESVDCVHRALSSLPARQRKVIVARDMEGRRPGEIAAALAISIGAVDSLLLRARRRVALAYQGLATEQGAVSTSVATAGVAATSAAGPAGPLSRLVGALSGALDSLSSQAVNLAGGGSMLPRAAQQLAGVAVAAALVAGPVAPAVVPEAAPPAHGQVLGSPLLAPLGPVAVPALGSGPQVPEVPRTVGTPVPGGAGDLTAAPEVVRPPAAAIGAEPPDGPSALARVAEGVPAAATAAGHLSTETLAAAGEAAGALVEGVTAEAAAAVAGLVPLLSDGSAEGQPR